MLIIDDVDTSERSEPAEKTELGLKSEEQRLPLWELWLRLGLRGGESGEVVDVEEARWEGRVGEGVGLVKAVFRRWRVRVVLVVRGEGSRGWKRLWRIFFVVGSGKREVWFAVEDGSYVR